MSFRPQQVTTLSDAQGRVLGRVVIDRVEGDLVFGQFTPMADYARVQSLFAEYVEAANDQLFSLVGELDAAIAKLGLQLGSPDGAGAPPIRDVQIGEGVITFRFQPEATGPQPPNGAAASRRSVPTVDRA